jgi:hypothetical protein
MTGSGSLPSNRALRRKANRRFKRRKRPPDLWTEVEKSLLELDATQPREPPDRDAAGAGEERERR